MPGSGVGGGDLPNYTILRPQPEIKHAVLRAFNASLSIQSKFLGERVG